MACRQEVPHALEVLGLLNVLDATCSSAASGYLLLKGNKIEPRVPTSSLNDPNSKL